MGLTEGSPANLGLTNERRPLRKLPSAARHQQRAGGRVRRGPDANDEQGVLNSMPGVRTYHPLAA